MSFLIQREVLSTSSPLRLCVSLMLSFLPHIVSNEFFHKYLSLPRGCERDEVMFVRIFIKLQNHNSHFEFWFVRNFNVSVCLCPDCNFKGAKHNEECGMNWKKATVVKRLNVCPLSAVSSLRWRFLVKFGLFIETSANLKGLWAHMQRTMLQMWWEPLVTPVSFYPLLTCKLLAF